MTAKEKLQALLDERGVDWYEIANITYFGLSEYESLYAATEYKWGGIILDPLTPEQTIAATLGAGTCKADETDLIPFVCVDGDSSEVDYIRVMECSSCGGTFEHVNGSYEFCPRCGRRIEVDE